MAEHPAPASTHLLPELQPGEDVWATLALPTLTLLATDRRLLTRSGDHVEAWDYGAISQVGPAGIEGDVVISFDGGHRPLVVHARGDETAMQALTVIGLLVARSRRLNRLRSATRGTSTASRRS
jgi:hypothetical protein